jgi:hypothetical protein
MMLLWQCHVSCGNLLASHHKGMGLIPGQLMSGLWWTGCSPSTCFPFASIILPLLYAAALFTCHQNHIALGTESGCYQLPVRVLI